MTIKNLEERSSSLAPSQLTGKTWRIKIIEGDRQGSSAYYPKEALEAGKSLFSKGVRIYENHPSSEDRWSQPERRVRDIIGYLSSEAEYDGKDLWANATFFSENQEWIKERAEAGVIAMSIRAEGKMTETADHGLELKEFTKVHSVDVVTVAGAGGAFGTMLESAKGNIAEEAQPKEETELELPKEFLESLDELRTAVAGLATFLTADKEAREAAAEAARVAAEEAAKPKALSAGEIADALVEAKLTGKARARVLAAVEGGAELKDAIEAEAEIAKEILAEAAANSGAGSFEEASKAPKAERESKLVESIFG